MRKLYRLNNKVKSKYNYKEDELYLVRYHKQFFTLLSEGCNKYIQLFCAFERGVEQWMSDALSCKSDTTLTLDSYRNGHCVGLSKKEYHMYLNFLENVIIPNLKRPKNDSKLMITTYNGGTHLAYYRNGRYKVPMASGDIRFEDKVIIDWRTY